jgi:catalase
VWDGVIVPGGAGSAEALASRGHAIEFLKDQYRHCKPMLVLGEASALLAKAGIPSALPSGAADPGLLVRDGGDASVAVADFAEALAQHRHFQRETDPPVI